MSIIEFILTHIKTDLDKLKRYNHL